MTTASFYLLALDLCIFNKRRLAEETAGGWPELGVPWSASQESQSCQGWERGNEHLGVCNPHKLHIGRALQVCGRFTQSWRLHTFHQPALLLKHFYSPSLHNPPLGSVVSLSTHCFCSWPYSTQTLSVGASVIYESFPWFSMLENGQHLFPELSVKTEGVWIISWEHLSPFDYWFFLRLECTLDITVESLGKGVILPKTAEGSEWK